MPEHWEGGAKEKMPSSWLHPALLSCLSGKGDVGLPTLQEEGFGVFHRHSN